MRDYGDARDSAERELRVAMERFGVKPFSSGLCDNVGKPKASRIAGVWRRLVTRRQA